MSGLTGHINHLYEDPTLTLSDVIKVYRSIANGGGELEVYEKVDGYNIYISYSVRDKKIRLVRKNEQLKTGGITLQELKDEFTTKRLQAGKKPVPSNVVAAYVNILGYFEKILKVAFNSDELAIAVFGGDNSGNPEYFFNAEVIDPSAPNVVKYERKLLVFHRLGNIKVNYTDGEIIETDTIDISQRLQQLSEIFGKSEGPNGIEITLDKPSTVDSVNTQTLERELGSLRSEFKKLGLDMNDDLGKFFSKSIEGYMAREKTKFDSFQLEFITKSILAVGFGRKFFKKPRINEFFMKSTVPSTPELKNFTNEEPAMEIFKKLRVPLEKIFFDLSSILLDKYESAYISNNKQTADDIIRLVNASIEKVKTTGTPEQKKKLDTNINKLRGSVVSFGELVNNPIEGIVFKFKKGVYKITSSFGPVNQIVGLTKFGHETLSESKTVEANGMKVLFAGAFKPPHKGHMQVIKNFIELPKTNKKNFTVEKIIVIVGDKSRLSKSNREFTTKQSLELFKLYIKSCNLESIIELRITGRDNPVKDVYDYIANPNNDDDKAQAGDVILLGVSKKDRNYYSNLAKFVKDKPWQVLFGEEFEIPMAFQDKNESQKDLLSELSASDFRDAISDNDTKKVDSFLPPEVLATPEYKKEAYRILGIQGYVEELQESAIVNIIRKKLSIQVERSAKLNLGDLISRVNSIYNK